MNFKFRLCNDEIEIQDTYIYIYLGLLFNYISLYFLLSQKQISGSSSKTFKQFVPEN